MCPVCEGSRWVEAAPVVEFDGFERSTYVGQFTPVPCFTCFGKVA